MYYVKLPKHSFMYLALLNRKSNKSQACMIDTFVHNQYLTFKHSTWWTQLGFTRMVLRKNLWANNENIVGPLIINPQTFSFLNKYYMHTKYANHKYNDFNIISVISITYRQEIIIISTIVMLQVNNREVFLSYSTFFL